jgi:hypothetical protein
MLHQSINTRFSQLPHGIQGEATIQLCIELDLCYFLLKKRKQPRDRRYGGFLFFFLQWSAIMSCVRPEGDFPFIDLFRSKRVVKLV